MQCWAFFHSIAHMVSSQAFHGNRDGCSLIRLTCQHFTYVASHLIEIETTINVPLGLPLEIDPSPQKV